MWTVAYLFLGIPAAVFIALFALLGLRLLSVHVANAFFDDGWGRKLASAIVALCLAVFLACAGFLFWLMGVWFVSDPSLVLADALMDRAIPVGYTMLGSALLLAMAIGIAEAVPPAKRHAVKTSAHLTPADDRPIGSFIAAAAIALSLVALAT